MEDRELSPTCAGHPRCEVEGDPEELEEDETIFEGKSRARIHLEFASDRRRRHRGASKKFDDLSGRESCRKIGRIVRERWKSLVRSQLQLETVKGVHSFS